MANTIKWNHFWKEFEKFPKIQPEVIQQKGIFGDGVILAYKANEMNEGEAVDIDYLSLSNRHYKKGCSGHFYDWLKRVYNHLDNYEYVVAAVVQAACYDLEKDHNKRKFFLNDIAFASSEKFGWCAATWIPNKYTRYFRDVEYDWYAENGYYTEENGYDKYYKMGHPMSIRKYQEAAEYVHNLMKNIFCYYQFVVVTKVEGTEEIKEVRSWTEKCREYRRLSQEISKDENLTEIYPCSSISFDGTITVRCEKHGIEHSITVNESSYKNSKNDMCPECKKELELIQEAEREKEWQKRQAEWAEKAELRRKRDLENFKALAEQRFGDFYDYSLVAEDYCDFYRTKVKIIHPEYGVFETTPASHLRSMSGYNKSHASNLPQAKEITYVLDGNGKKIAAGSKVKWQINKKPTWYHGTIVEISDYYVKVCKNSDGKIEKKERSFLFAE